MSSASRLGPTRARDHGLSGTPLENGLDTTKGTRSELVVAGPRVVEFHGWRMVGQNQQLPRTHTHVQDQYEPEAFQVQYPLQYEPLHVVVVVNDADNDDAVGDDVERTLD